MFASFTCRDFTKNNAFERKHIGHACRWWHNRHVDTNGEGQGIINHQDSQSYNLWQGWYVTVTKMPYHRPMALKMKTNKHKAPPFLQTLLKLACPDSYVGRPHTKGACHDRGFLPPLPMWPLTGSRTLFDRPHQWFTDHSLYMRCMGITATDSWVQFLGTNSAHVMGA